MPSEELDRVLVVVNGGGGSGGGGRGGDGCTDPDGTLARSSGPAHLLLKLSRTRVGAWLLALPRVLLLRPTQAALLPVEECSSITLLAPSSIRISGPAGLSTFGGLVRGRKGEDWQHDTRSRKSCNVKASVQERLGEGGVLTSPPPLPWTV